MSEETKTKSEKLLEADDTINNYYGIEETKVYDMTSEKKTRITSSLQKQLERATKRFHAHLRGRILELIDPSDWVKFGVLPNPGQKPDPKFDPAIYHKDVKGYEKRYQDKVSGFAAIDMPEFSENPYQQKIELKNVYEKELERDRENINNINLVAKKYGIKLTPYKG
jgi:hypothetical protein